VSQNSRRILPGISSRRPFFVVLVSTQAQIELKKELVKQLRINKDMKDDCYGLRRVRVTGKITAPPALIIIQTKRNTWASANLISRILYFLFDGVHRS